MVLKRLGAFCAIAILPAMAHASDDAAIKAAVIKAFQAQHGPIRIVKQDLENGAVQSTNWSGYAVTGKAFKSVTGSWIEPAITCNSSSDTEIVAVWAGLDGYNDSTVEQTGTIAACVNGAVEHLAWWELYPLNAIQVINTITVHSGDKFSASVTYSAKTKKYAMKITDETTGKTFTKRATQSGTKRASAEFIVEAPCCVSSNTVYPLPNFGTAVLGKDSTGIANTNDAAEKSHSGGFNTFPSADVFSITMVNASTSATEAQPSAPSSDGTSFSVQWVSP